MTVTGGCRCGESRYAIVGDALPPVYCCHCLDCQTWSGSAYTMQAVIRDDAVTATGPVVEYVFANPSGLRSTQIVCGTCHTRLWNVNDARPGLAVVRAGTLDSSNTIAPRMHMWTRRKQPWIVIDPAVPAFAETPPRADFMAIMLARG